MESLLLLIPLSALVIIAAAAVFWWAVDARQFEDVERQGRRTLFDEPVLDESLFAEKPLFEEKSLFEGKNRGNAAREHAAKSVNSR